MHCFPVSSRLSRVSMKNHVDNDCRGCSCRAVGVSPLHRHLDNRKATVYCYVSDHRSADNKHHRPDT